MPRYKDDRYIFKIIGGFIYLLVVAGIAYFGIFLLQYDMDMIGCFCLSIATFCIIMPFVEHLEKLKEKRQQILRRIYNIPAALNHEYGEVWDKEFQKVITKAIETTNDSAKRADLHQCQRVAKEMNKNSCSYKLDSPFYEINNAFRLTGCHFTITDSQGETIAQIV